MKLLIVGPHPFPNNGISTYIGHYADELSAQGHDVRTECIYFWASKLANWKWFRVAGRLDEGFDAVIVQFTPTASGPLLPWFLRRARARGVPVVVVGHEAPSVYSKHLPRLLRGLYHAYERAVYTGAARAIVHTELHAAELAAIGLRTPPVVIPHPLFTTAAPTLEGTREAWGAYGMISHKKGLDLLLEAYQSRPPGHFPPLRILGGPAPGNDRYVETLKESIRPEFRGRVTFHGYIAADRLADELGSLSLMILPYRWVSQSAVLAEACRFRIPYLASDLPYFADFKARYGCGELFPRNDAAALLRALDALAAHPLRVSDAEFDRVLADLRLDRCAERLVAEIASVARAPAEGNAS